MAALPTEWHRALRVVSSVTLQPYMRRRHIISVHRVERDNIRMFRM